MDKTIRQLAEEYGMTKQAMQYHIKKLPERCKNFTTKKGVKILLVNPEGQEILRFLLAKNQTKEVAKFTGKEVENFTTKEKQPKLYDEADEKLIKQEFLGSEPHHEASEAVIELLRKELEEKNEQLREKDRQIREKDQQIDQLHKLIDQEQQLRMVTEQKFQLLEQTQKDTENKGFISRFFRR